jgi:hypothetical protein
MTTRHASGSLTRTAALAGCIALAASVGAPFAHADPLDGIRGAVNGARAQSTCPALTYSGQLEAAAQEMARQAPDTYLHINPHGYPGLTSGNLVRDDPTAKATSELVEQERNNIHNCANTDFGVGMFRDAGADQSVVTVVLGKPASPSAGGPPPVGNQQAQSQPFGPDTCAQGYVWREAIPSDHVCVTPDVRSRTQQENSTAASLRDPNGAYGSNSCKPGYVWRNAFNGDAVCVTPDIRSQVAAENAAGPSHLAHG